MPRRYIVQVADTLSSYIETKTLQDEHITSTFIIKAPMPTTRSTPQLTSDDPSKSAHQSFTELKSTLVKKPLFTTRNKILPSDGRLLIERLEAERAIGESRFRCVASSYHRVRNGCMSYICWPCCWRLPLRFSSGTSPVPSILYLLC